ncbi:hypothetical protein PHYSODRAFT_507731 [Phytophthora sojae]|uniref:HAT C-terminal dimerisation domain-containing protein n=1 Tax=Phytophthora sojae (strain P6497) TaxID=1094619 RepID=G4ZQ39_PHYSP|nr:hypothetical protein PHYSODRAFT_507731 [Phytophthora sojae]EGZ14428.1 hypothetical protein PHYSODRAFT_507731 [Phytophthora sojae]|eukprot:XP_009528177.1 hypothetical protein PHYSODRAFT_507731 [Phytophthora sojae]
MLERYGRIRDEIKRVGAVYDLVSKPATHRRIIALTEILTAYARSTLSMSAVRVLFGKMAEMFPITSPYMSPDADIVHSPVFESAVVKVIMLRHAALLCSDDVPSEAGPRYSLLVRAIPWTSNCCESHFSQCKLVMTPQRSSLLPINFEMIAVLVLGRPQSNGH